MVTYPSSNGPQPILYNYFWICLSALMDICFWCELRCPESQKGTIAQCIHLRRLCPAPFPSPRVPGTSPQSFIQSLQRRIYHPSIHPVSHSFIPSPRDPCKHQPFIANMTYNSIFDTFRSACGKMSCWSLLNWLICNRTCFPWTLRGCLYFCHIHLRLSTLRLISVYLPPKGTSTWKATQMQARIAKVLQNRQKKAALFPKKATFACLHHLCSQKRPLHS